jgi:squalene-hopene/tetraprenyl-beta-curcumene cyclase
LDWKEIDPLPFELACVPQSWYRFVGMPVVSYAIPALVAIGQARYHHAPPWNPVTRLVRWLSITRSLRVLRRMQPDSGGYLEATPLTAFVVMSLASIQSSRHAPRDEPRAPGSSAPPGLISRSEMATFAGDVINEGVRFLANSIREDGSWPIDTNLATWNTTLAINALAGAGEDVAELLGVSAVGNALRGVPGPADRSSGAVLRTARRAFPTENRKGEASNVLDWLLSCQHTDRHPFTGADAGGFGWSDLSGAVPDADDTPGALLALDQWAVGLMEQDSEAAWESLCHQRGLGQLWLEGLQNRDGGWPTFCRGWGRLPFDRSGVDLTAHAIRAINSPILDSQQLADVPSVRHTQQTIRRGLLYINRMQHPDGSWSPLWFGNQDHPEEDNPVYGTAKVLFAYRDLGLMDSPEAQRGVAWLVANQNADGGWGSGVWEKARARGWGLGREQAKRSAEAGARSDIGFAEADHSVLGTQYSVLSTGQLDVAQSQIPMGGLQSSVEETALAVEALLAAFPTDGTPMADPRNATEGVPYREQAKREPASYAPHPSPNPEPRTPNPASSSPQPPALAPSLARGLAWLLARVEAGQHRQPAPIGFYFAKLWYYERLYPLTFTVAALGRACRQFARPAQPDPHPVATELSKSVPKSTRAP